MITIHQGSILDAKVDYIVNPANNFLQHGGGLARVIADAATAPWLSHPLDRFDTDLDGSPVALMRADRQKHVAAIQRWQSEHDAAPLIATGDAYMTSAGVLPYRGVIHAVGPIWKDGSLCETELIKAAYDSALLLVPNGCRVALPAISAGIFRAPIDVVARAALGAPPWFADLDIEFWLFSDAHREAFEHELDCQTT